MNRAEEIRAGLTAQTEILRIILSNVHEFEDEIRQQDVSIPPCHAIPSCRAMLEALLAELRSGVTREEMLGQLDTAHLVVEHLEEVHDYGHMITAAMNLPATRAQLDQLSTSTRNLEELR